MTEHTQPTPPLPLSVRMSDVDFLGVVACLGPDWRLSVSMDAKRYVLQQRAPTHLGFVWVSAGRKSPNTLKGIVAKYGATVAGLVDAVADLPDDPAEAVPVFAASARAMRSVLDARDVTRPDYARILGTGTGTLRLAVDPDGTHYVVLWTKREYLRAGKPQWRVVHRADTLTDLRAWFHGSVGEVVGSGSSGVLRGDALMPSYTALVRGLPERASAGVWPYVPAAPGLSPQA